MARGKRVLVGEGVTGVYHCISRVVGGEMYLSKAAKEVLRKQLWQVAGFCGVEVLTYCLMTNHIHILVRVKASGELTDAELLKRVRLLYANKPAKVQYYESVFKTGGDVLDAVRAELLARMGSVSEFMKTLKQRFSIWYNKSQGRYGTLWAERFKSLLIDEHSPALRIVAAYIDLNPVRAGICKDPKDYRWCGYAEALGGSAEARKGLNAVMLKQRWDAAQRGYRELLFGQGTQPKASGAPAIDRQAALKVLNDGGRLPLHQLLRCRVRYFSEGAVLGSKEFVRDWYQGAKKGKEALHPVQASVEAKGLFTGRPLRKAVIEV